MLVSTDVTASISNTQHIRTATQEQTSERRDQISFITNTERQFHVTNHCEAGSLQLVWNALSAAPPLLEPCRHPTHHTARQRNFFEAAKHHTQFQFHTQKRGVNLDVLLRGPTSSGDERIIKQVSQAKQRPSRQSIIECENSDEPLDNKVA